MSARQHRCKVSPRKGDPAGRGRGNSRNGTSSKTILTEGGEVEIAVPRDRAGSFELQLVAKGQTHFDGFDDKILSLYARGMTVREIQGHLEARAGTRGGGRPNLCMRSIRQLCVD